MNHKATFAWAWLAVSWLLAGCGVAVRPNGDGGGPNPDVPVMDAPGGCRLSNGQVLAVGQSAFDGCNTCSCGPGGILACTGRACVDVVSPPASCETPDGSRILVGETWSSVNRCTLCVCSGPDALQCRMNPSCVDAGPPPVCIGPDGTPIPVGSTATTRDGCFRCGCVDPSLPPRCIPTADGRCTDGGVPLVCRAPDGTPLPVGSSWTSPDRCTNCVCGSGGSLSCATRPGCFDSGVLTCRAPDGSSIPANTGWASRDGCTNCFCSASGTLSCASNPRCFDAGVDAGRVCSDPSGTPIPIGACFGDRCQSCCCTSTGLSCVTTGDPSCFDAGLACNTVPLSPIFASVRAGVGSPPSGSGGTFVDGLYRLRELVYYGGPTPPVMGVRYSVQITRGTMQFFVDLGTGPGSTQRVNFSFVTGGSLIRLTQTCTSSGGGMSSASGFYSIRPDGFDLYIDSGSGFVQHLNFIR